MAELKKIRTPWRQQWRRIRYQLIPVITMAACSVAVGILWHRQYGGTDALGHIEEVQAAAASRQEGMLVPMARKAWSLYDKVIEDEVIARLDDRQAMAQLGAVQAEIGRLRSQLAGIEGGAPRDTLADAQFPVAAATGPAHPPAVASALHPAVQLELARLAALQEDALALQLRVEVQRQEGVLTAARDEVLKEPLEPAERAAATAARDAAQVKLTALSERREAHARAAEAARARMAAAAQAQGRLDKSAPDDVEAALAPVRAAVRVHEAALRGVELEIDGLEIRAPLTGKIVLILRRPGQAVQPGDEVMHITREQSDRAITYVRSDQGVLLAKDTPVYVWPLGARGKPIEGRVESVGPRIQQVPELVSRNQKIREWGLPVLVRLPPGYRARPGDVVSVRFPRGEEGQR